MISRIVRCAAHSPLQALVFAPLLALAASGTPSFAAQETDEAERNATVTESASEDPNAPGSPRFLGSAIEWNLGDAESAPSRSATPMAVSRAMSSGRGRCRGSSWVLRGRRGCTRGKLSARRRLRGRVRTEADLCAAASREWVPRVWRRPGTTGSQSDARPRRVPAPKGTFEMTAPGCSTGAFALGLFAGDTEACWKAPSGSPTTPRRPASGSGTNMLARAFRPPRTYGRSAALRTPSLCCAAAALGAVLERAGASF